MRKGWWWLCVRGELETEQTSTYWPQVPLTIAELLPHSAGLLNLGPEGQSPLSGAGSHSVGNCDWDWTATLTPTQFELPVAPGFIIVWHPPTSRGHRMCTEFNPSAGQDDIFDRMHLFLDWRLGRGPICYSLAFSNLVSFWVLLRVSWGVFSLRCHFDSFSIFSHVAYPFGFSVMFLLFPYFSPKLFCCLVIWFLVCLRAFSPSLLVEIFIVFECPTLNCLILSRCLFSFPSFVGNFWFISLSCIICFNFCVAFLFSFQLGSAFFFCFFLFFFVCSVLTFFQSWFLSECNRVFFSDICFLKFFCINFPRVSLSFVWFECVVFQSLLWCKFS